MEEFNKEELQESLERLSKKSYRYGLLTGCDGALQAVEKFLDLEKIPDPLPKELLRFHINECRKGIEVDKQKLLNNEENKDEDKEKDKDKDN